MAAAAYWQMRQGMLDKKNGRGYSIGGALECMLNVHEERMLQGPSVQEIESIASRSNGKGGKGGKGGDSLPHPREVAEAYRQRKRRVQ